MNSLDHGPVAETLKRLFEQAESSDGRVLEELGRDATSFEEVIQGLIEAERRDLAGVYRQRSNDFLAISRDFGRFLYMMVRSVRPRCIVDFGTSMGVSTIHLAAGLRDAGGGRLIGTELEAPKAERARRNLAEAGLDHLCEIRVGDARETLRDLPQVDVVLLDGAFTIYREVLAVLQPRLHPGSLLIAENAFEGADDYLDHVRDPDNGYVSLRLPVDLGRGNEFTVVA